MKKKIDSIYTDGFAVLKSKISTTEKNGITFSYQYYFYECVETKNTFGSYETEHVSYENGMKEYKRLLELKQKGNKKN